MTSIYRKYLVKAALIWAGCFVLFFFVYIVVLVPQKNHEKQTESRLAEKKQAYRFILNAAQNETKLKLAEQIEHLRNRLDDFVIDFEDSANLTFDISQIANEKKLGMFSSRSKDDSGESALPDCEYLHEHHIDVSFTAGFNQFATFLNALERHRPFIFIDRFTITRPEQADSSPQPGSQTQNGGFEQAQADMSLAVFVRKEQQS